MPTKSYWVQYRPAVLIEAFYFHVNGSIGIVQKIEFEIRPDLGCRYNLQNVEKSGFGQPVCVCVSGCLAVDFAANFHERKGEPIDSKL